MKKFLLIVGIVSLIACVLLFIMSAFNLWSYYNVLDGSNALYDRLHQRMILCLVIGIVLLIVGAVCLIIRRKM